MTSVTGELREAVAADPDVLFAYLHGSFAEGFPEYRDIDVALYFREGMDADVRLDRALEMGVLLSYRLGKNVDVHVLNDTPIEFQFAVTSGVLLFSRDEATRLEFVERTWLRYFDFEPLLRQNLRDLLEA